MVFCVESVCVCEERRVCGATDSAWGVFVPCACEKELDPCWEAKCPHHVMLMNASRRLPALMSHQIICHLLNVWIHRTVIWSYLRNNCTVIVVYYHRCSQISVKKNKITHSRNPVKLWFWHMRPLISCRRLSSADECPSTPKHISGNPVLDGSWGLSCHKNTTLLSLFLPFNLFHLTSFLIQYK